MEARLIARGAEAEIWEQDYLGKKAIFKKRVPKKYRDPALDKQLRKERTKAEATLIHQGKELGIRIPVIYKMIPSEGLLVMEKINGERMKEHLKKKNLSVMKQAGKMVALLHSAGLVHGDLTTSNLLVNDTEIAIVDFGLGFGSTKIEDLAVDILNFQKTYKATHYQFPQGWEYFLESYKQHFEAGDRVLRRIKQIEERARYS